MVDVVDVNTDREAIMRVVHDYFGSWYEGDAQRMGQSLHPNLAKRAPMAALLAFGSVQEGDPDSLDEDTRQTMVDATGWGIGAKRATTAEHRSIEVQIDDVYHWIASVTVRFAHLSRVPPPGPDLSGMEDRERALAAHRRGRRW